MCRRDHRKEIVMSKSRMSIAVLAGALILGLLIWNIYLINEVGSLKDQQKELELKYQMLEGDNDMLSYDLITCRDSIRILNKRFDLK
jgi:Tfp pilus assembly protein PilO